MNCRGDDDIDAKRSRPSIGNTRLWATRGKNACDWLGPDPRITSGPAATAAASRWGKPLRENRPHTWLHPNASQKSQICSCNAGTVHTWPFASLVACLRFCCYRIIADIGPELMLNGSVEIDPTATSSLVSSCSAKGDGRRSLTAWPFAYCQSGTASTFIVSSSGRSNPKCCAMSVRRALRSAN